MENLLVEFLAGAIGVELRARLDISQLPVDYRTGLAGAVRMQFKSADVLDHGVVQLAYAVLPPDA